MLARWIIDAIDKKGLKATAKGNLPQKLCRNTALDFRKGLQDDDIHHRIRVNKEEDFMDLHVTRIILELSGLLRRTKGRFFLTRKYYQLNDQLQKCRTVYEAIPERLPEARYLTMRKIIPTKSGQGKMIAAHIVLLPAAFVTIGNHSYLK